MPLPTDYRRSKATTSRSTTSRTTTTEPFRPGARLALALLAAQLGLGACGGDDLLLPSSGEPARIEIVTGNDQADTVGRPLRDSLVVRVTDPEARPVEGVEVAFVTPAGALAPSDTVFTGPDGRAAVYYTLDTVSGEQTIEARARPVVPSPSLTTIFRVSAEPDAAAGLIADGGDEQEAEVLTPLEDSLAVKAVDRFGNGVAGVEVTWQATDGAVSPASVVTGSDGRGATQRTLGARPGLYPTTAVALALENATVSFEATGIAPPSPQLILVTQPSSSASAGVPFERQPVLQLQDAVGAPLLRGDVVVTVQIADGAGSLSGTTTARSNAEGRVSFTDLSIRGLTGDRTLLFAAVDFTPARSRRIDVNAGPPSAGQSSASGPNGTAGVATPVSIQLADEFGNVVEGAAGLIAVSIEGANPASGLGVTEQGGGSYSAAYTPLRSGTDQVSVQVNGNPVGGSPFPSLVAAGPPDPATTTAVVTATSQIFFWTVDVVVTTRDTYGNLLGRGGASVQVDDGTPREVRDNGDGTYVASFATFFLLPVAINLNGVPIAGSPYTPTAH